MTDFSEASVETSASLGESLRAEASDERSVEPSVETLSGTDEEIKAMQEALEGARTEVQRHLETIALKEARIGELEGALAQQQQAMDSQMGEASAVRGELAMAIARYRALLLAGAPEVPEELVGGETLDEVDASLERARDLVQRVKRQVETRAAQERVPAGAPARTAPDLSGLSPREKIAYALARQQS